jgi:hypothetical protein
MNASHTWGLRYRSEYRLDRPAGMGMAALSDDLFPAWK